MKGWRTVAGQAQAFALRAGRRADRYRRPEDDSALLHDAQRYWRGEADEAWRANSHWRGAGALDDDTWLGLGQEQLRLFRMLAAGVHAPRRFGRVVEWGCGGGANAVHFAPLAEQLILVDVSSASVEECTRQVASACDTPVLGLVAEIDDPEVTAARFPGPCDLFICLFVLELVPSPAYGLRLLDIARDALREGGLAFLQFKYETSDPASRPRRRGYRRNLADMTTYRIDEFWVAALERGLDPIALHLVPRHGHDERYAYCLLARPDGSPLVESTT
jgi:SAM-dependent methyltransferase